MISPPPHQIMLTVEMAVMMTNPCALMVLPVTGTYMYIMIKTKTAKNNLHDMQYVYCALECLLEFKKYQFNFLCRLLIY